MERRLKRADEDGYEYAYNVTNVEYTEFDRLGVPDECLDGSQYSRYPANTNVLYIGLQVSIRQVGLCFHGQLHNVNVAYTSVCDTRQDSFGFL